VGMKGRDSTQSVEVVQQGKNNMLWLHRFVV
jgi:hypothetical protein